MTIQQIKYIIAVEEFNHFGLAAEKCFVTQSTLSTMIGKFEEEIGIRIFDRSTKPVTVTLEGEVLLPQLKIILKEVDSLDERVKLMKGEVSGKLKIGIIPTVAPYVLPRFLGDFVKNYPKMHFSVSELTTDNIVEQIKSRALDIGIAALPLGDDSLIEYPIYNESFVLYDCFSNRPSSSVKIEDINYDKFWLLEEGHCLSNQVIKICDIRNKNAPVNLDFRAGTIDTLIRFVKQNHGITLLPCLATTDFSEEDCQRLSHFKGSVPVRSIGIVTHKHFVKKQVLSLLTEKIRENIVPLLRLSSQENQIITPL